MTTYVVKTDYQRQMLIRAVEAKAMPFTASLVKGAHRSEDQNKLQRKWLLEAQDQGDQAAEEYRGYCKLHFGVPIMRAENDVFREKYDRLIRPFSYPEKLELMMVPMDFPVTRIMTTDQKTRYLNTMYQHFTGLGMVLTIPPGSSL